MNSLGFLKSPIIVSTVRRFSISSCRNIREVIRDEDDKTITIKGTKLESPRTKNLIDPAIFQSSSSCEAYDNCHPFCRFDRVHEVKHTDVLIIDQFVDSNGDIIPRKITGLCERQHYRMNKLIGMAQKAGLLDSKDKFSKEKVTKPWAKYNSYWDEKTIDIQWNELQRKKNLRYFKK